MRKESFLSKGFLVPIAIVFLWWYGSSHGWWNSFLLPSPGDVADAFILSFKSGELETHVWASLSRIIRGFGLSCLSCSRYGSFVLGFRVFWLR